MSVYSERGVVLHSIKYSENQLIIHIFTESRGRKSYITRVGGRGRSLFQPLSLVEFNAVTGRGEIDKLSQAALTQPLTNIPHDIVKSTVSLFIAEVLYRVIKDASIDKRLFDFIHGSVVALDLIDNPVANFHLHFMVRLSHYMGFAPQGRHSEGCWFDIKNGCFTEREPDHLLKINPVNATLLYRLSQIQTSEIHTINLNREQRTVFLDYMVDYYGYHTESIYAVNSISIFRELF